MISTNRQVFVTGLAVAAGTLVTARAEATGADGHAGGTHRSEDIKVVTGHHITLVKPSDLIQEHVFQVRNFGSTAGVCPVVQHQQSRPHLVLSTAAFNPRGR